MTEAEIRVEAALLTDEMARRGWAVQIERRPDGQQVATFCRDGSIKRSHGQDATTAILRAIMAEEVKA